MNERLPIQDYQTALIEQLVEPAPTIVGLEGGPCGGKSTLTKVVAREAAAAGRHVIAIGEAATSHIAALQERGDTIPELAAYNRPGYLNFQRDVLATIKDSLQTALIDVGGTDALITIDRPDIRAYVTPAEHAQLLAAVGLSEPPIHSLVDQLVYMPTVARFDPELYGHLRKGNAARYETTPEQAVAVCDKNLEAVRTHPELHVMWGGDFETEVRRLAGLVLHPEREGEIKLGVGHGEAEDFIIFARLGDRLLNTMDIRQSYHELNGREYRLRASRGNDGHEHYFFTMKQGEGAFRTELQRRLTLGEYGLMLAAPRIGKTLHKLRHVVLGEAEDTGKQRVWFADRYHAPALNEWHFETDVADRAEYDQLAARYEKTRRVITEGAKTLIFK